MTANRPPCRCWASVIALGLTLSQASLWLGNLFLQKIQLAQRPESVFAGAWCVSPPPAHRCGRRGGAPGLYTLNHLKKAAPSKDPGVRVEIRWAQTLVDAIQKAGGDQHRWPTCKRLVVQRRLPGADSRFKRTSVWNPAWAWCATVTTASRYPLLFRWRHDQAGARLPGKMPAIRPSLASPPWLRRPESPST